ncbi:MAG TPA: hypothetical protein VN950_07415 [Terriglobales bacterium]|nr:hypothetical protein [Terriglobales bacterium]
MKVRNLRSVVKLAVSLAVLIASVVTVVEAQQSNSVVPALVNFSGTLADANGKPLTGTAGVTFYLYKDQQGGSPLWMETQNVQADKTGHYTVALGASKSEGLPTNLFASGEARWLGVQAQGQAEQPRVLLLSVPYALKAGDAQTIGGLSPSAFVLAAAVNSSGASSSSSSPNVPPLGGTGTSDYLPIWTNSTTLGSSVLFQSGTGTTAKVGIGTVKPASTLDVKGGGTIRGLFSLPATGTATASKSFNSQAMDLAASAFNSGTSTAVTQTFQWQAEPVGNNTKNASGSLNLLFAQGTGKASETGLNIASNGQITFAKGQTFPGTGDGTITGVTAGTDLTGGGNSGKVTLNVDTTKVVTGVTAGADLTGGGVGGNLTLNLDTTKVPQLNAANSFTGNQTIKGNVSDTGNINATGSITGQTGVFSASNGTQVVNVTQSGTGIAINATVPTNSSLFTPAIQGTANGTTNPYGIGVQGISSAGSGYGVLGEETNSNANTGGYGVAGSTQTSSGAGVFGIGGSSVAGSSTDGVYGQSSSPNGFGVDAYNANNTSGVGVRGYTYAAAGIGVYGFWTSASSIGTNSSQIGVWGDSSSGDGVVGTSDNAYGVEGVSNNNIGVSGYSNNNNGIFGLSGTSYGVEGVGAISGVNGGSTFGNGVSGYASATGAISGVQGTVYSSSGSGSGLGNAGVWGDSGENNSFGVAGTTDNGNSFFGKNNTVNHETLYIENDSGFNGGTPYAARFAGPGSSTYCSIYRDSNDNGTGDLDCTGSINGAVVVGGNRMVNMYAVEAADNWFEDAGSGQLVDGSTTVALDRIFAQTVNGDVDYHVFLTPNGECEGLYVTKKGAQGFEVHELHHGHSNIAFDYRIMARRKGFEKVRMQDVTQDFARMKQESDQLATRVEARKQEQKAHHPIVKPADHPMPKPLPSFHPATPHTPVFPAKQSLVGSVK